MIYIGIDPGYERCGFAVVQKDTQGNESILHSECFKTSATSPFEQRLLEIAQQFRHLIEEHQPETCAIEKLFFTNNQKTAMRVAEVRGVLILTAYEAGLNVQEYSPNEVKVAVTGDGSSSKQQIILMLPKLISITKKVQYDDEYDAIAVALTASATLRPVSS